VVTCDDNPTTVSRNSLIVYRSLGYVLCIRLVQVVCLLGARPLIKLQHCYSSFALRRYKCYHRKPISPTLTRVAIRTLGVQTYRRWHFISCATYWESITSEAGCSNLRVVIPLTPDSPGLI